jgi:catechol 2,3-dioxygenase-like lactoylglutathione lyase family enzyme
MSALRVEHVNISVTDPSRTAQLMEDIFDWRVRWSGPARNGGHSIHVGSTDHYIALYGAAQPDAASPAFTKGNPLNHIGGEVDDIDATEARVVAAGLQPFNHDDYEPGRRFYFFDPDGIEYEVVSYYGAS